MVQAGKGGSAPPAAGAGVQPGSTLEPVNIPFTGLMSQDRKYTGLQATPVVWASKIIGLPVDISQGGIGLASGLVPLSLVLVLASGF